MSELAKLSIDELRRTLPLVLEPSQVQEILGMSRSSLYEALREQKIPGVLRIGRLVRVQRDQFLEWLGAKR